MISKKLRKKGFSIVTTLIISSIVLALVGSIFYKFSISGKDLVRDSARKRTEQLAVDRFSDYKNFVSNFNRPGKTNADKQMLASQPASAFFVNEDTKFNGYEFQASKSNLNNTKPIYFYHSDKDEFEISTVDLGNEGTDKYRGFNAVKVEITAYIPSKGSSNATVRKFEGIINRTFPAQPAPSGVATPTPVAATPTPVAPTPTPTPAGKDSGKSGKDGKDSKSSGKDSKSSGKDGKNGKSGGKH